MKWWGIVKQFSIAVFFNYFWENYNYSDLTEKKVHPYHGSNNTVYCIKEK